jgi:hypothetical protein
MDNYQNSLAYWHIRSHIHKFGGFKECTDLILDVLVIEKILTQERDTLHLALLVLRSIVTLYGGTQF